LPPLRQRREDIPDLVQYFLRYYSEANNRFVVKIEKQALESLQDYHWPGNVRELQNYVERSVIMADGDELTLDLLPEAISGRQSNSTFATNLTGNIDLDSLVRELVARGIAGDENADPNKLHSRVVDRVEKELIAQVLQLCNHVQIKAAHRLGINRNTLHKKLKDYGLDEGEDEDGSS
jgi:DNA-binding NtrC family response regulator